MRSRLLLVLIGLILIGISALAVAQEPTPEATAPAPEATAPAPVAVAVAVAEAGPATPGDPAAGEAKAAACGACHGMDGNSADPQYPKIAGQHELYTARQLALYKSGERENPIMLGFSATLSAQDMRDIGAFFAAKEPLVGVADEQLAERGQTLYRGGSRQAGTPACMACHGPSGRGNPGSKYPALAGQHADYTKAQLIKFRDGTVWGKGDNANSVMAGVATYLTDQDIEALSSYVEGLYHATSDAAAASSP